MATKTVSVLTGGTNNHTETAENINALGTDFISQGIVGAISATSGVAPTTGGFAVNAQGTPNMTVRVTNGVAYVTGTPTSGNSQLFRVSMSTYEDITIAANSSGSTKYDHIYIKLDATKLKDPAVDASDVATLVASRSTSASTDDGTPPTYGYKIAVVTVVNSATSIANASITDSRVQTGASAVTGNNIIAANNLATSAITLGYAQITSSVTTTATSAAQATGLTATVTIPAGSRKIKITAHGQGIWTTNAGASQCWVTIWDGTVGSGTQLAATRVDLVSNYVGTATCIAVVTPAAGTKTYNVGLHCVSAGTTTLLAGATSPAFILVEAI